MVAVLWLDYCVTTNTSKTLISDLKFLKESVSPDHMSLCNNFVKKKNYKLERCAIIVLKSIELGQTCIWPR